MKKGILASAILGLAVLSTPVLAVTSVGHSFTGGQRDDRSDVMYGNPHRQCMAMEVQFDRTIGLHETAAKAGDARTLRADAGKLCASGQSEKAIVKLQQAFRDLGVPPIRG